MEQQTKTAFTFVVEPFGLEVTVAAATETEARTQLWDFYLSTPVKDGFASIECIEQRVLA